MRRQTLNSINFSLSHFSSLYITRDEDTTHASQSTLEVHRVRSWSRLQFPCSRCLTLAADRNRLESRVVHGSRYDRKRRDGVAMTSDARGDSVSIVMLYGPPSLTTNDYSGGRSCRCCGCMATTMTTTTCVVIRWLYDGERSSYRLKFDTVRVKRFSRPHAAARREAPGWRHMPTG